MRLSDSMRSRPASNDMNRDEETRPLMEPAEPKRPAVTYRIHEQLEPDRWAIAAAFLLHSHISSFLRRVLI